MVLIAQSAINDALFAIEHVEDRIYAMCRLGKWVTVKTLQQLHNVPIDIVRPRKRQPQEQPGLPGDKWWSTAAIDFNPENRYDQGKESGVEDTRAVRLCLQPAQQKSAAPAQITQEISQPVLQPVLQDQTENIMTDVVEAAAQEPEEVFRMIRVQYQEALYTSKVGIFPHEFSDITDCKLSRHWPILQKAHCLEHELPFLSRRALSTITCL